MGLINSKDVRNTKNVNNEIILSEVHNTNMTRNVSTPVKINHVDPRSPSADIVRTPIETIPMILSKLKDDCLEPIEEYHTPNSSFSDHDSTPPSSKYTPNSDIPCKILAKNITDENESDKSSINNLSDKRISKIGLLETNLDFIETDIDLVTTTKNKKLNYQLDHPKDLLQAKIRKNIEQSAVLESTPPSAVLKPGSILELTDPRSPSLIISRTPIQVVKPLDVDPRSPTVEFQRTPIVFTCTPDNDNVNSNTEFDVVKENIENFVQKLDTLCVTDSEDETPTNKVETVERSCTPPLKDLKSAVVVSKQVIYEDKNTNSEQTPVFKSLENANRTPLSIRSGNTRNNVNKKDLKSAYAVSKIPVYNKNLKKLYGKQCENTPPNDENQLRKRIQWDVADSTLII